MASRSAVLVARPGKAILAVTAKAPWRKFRRPTQTGLSGKSLFDMVVCGRKANFLDMEFSAHNHAPRRYPIRLDHKVRYRGAPQWLRCSNRQKPIWSR